MVEHERFIARRRARFDGIDGKVNIPYGTALTCQDGFLMHKNQRVCAVGSQNGMDCFVQDDDGNGTLSAAPEKAFGETHLFASSFSSAAPGTTAPSATV